MGLAKGVVNMFYTPEVLIKQKQYRINLLNARDPATNAKLVKALEREIRALQKVKDDGND